MCITKQSVKENTSREFYFPSNEGYGCAVLQKEKKRSLKKYEKDMEGVEFVGIPPAACAHFSLYRPPTRPARPASLVPLHYFSLIPHNTSYQFPLRFATLSHIFRLPCHFILLLVIFHLPFNLSPNFPSLTSLSD